MEKYTELKAWCQKVIPLVYDDSLSYYEFLCKILKKLNDLGLTFNEFLEWVNIELTKRPTKEFINKNMKLSNDGDFTGTWHGLEMHFSDEGLATDWNNAKGDYATVSERLDKLLYSGEILVSRIGRVINTKSSDVCSSDIYTNPQGFCFTGTNYYCAYRDYNGTGQDVSCKIVKYDNEFNVLTSIVGEYGHGNSICFDGQFIYVSDITDKIHVFKADNLEYVTTHTLPFNCYAISYHQGKFYITGSSIYITENFQTFETINYTLPSNSGVAQGSETDGQFMYMLRTSPNMILKYNLKGELKKIIKLPLYSDYVFKLGETEDLTIIGDKVYFNCVLVDEENEREINSFFYSNLVENISMQSYQTFMQLNKTNNAFTIFVDPTNVNKNPFGTFSNPFPTLYEALSAMQSLEMGNCIINIKTGITEINENINFHGTFNDIRIVGLSTCQLGNVSFGRCSLALINCKAKDLTLSYVNQAVLDCGFNSLTATGSTFKVYGGLLTSDAPIKLYASTMEGVELLTNINVYDYGCHGVFKQVVNLQIGNTFNSTLVSKAKIIEVSINANGKRYTRTITKTGINELDFMNIYNGSAGLDFYSFHVNITGDNLIFQDVRKITIDKVAETISTPNSTLYIEGLTFIL